ncbi:MAG: lysine--tRNA ligase [Rhizobiales bacterium]|nr:lysine--tRNA ligase [Hyphomicrobiales bacterium]
MTSAITGTLSPLAITPKHVDAARMSKAWPFEEARKLVKRITDLGKKEAIFETGYGPSGLPHIGTFGEVARTTMVRTAFRLLTEDQIPTRLLCVSDDMDGMRKIPGNVPNTDMLKQYLGKPLTVVPNPFGGIEPSFGHHNNAKLREFLDRFGFQYEFQSATALYQSGRFDAMLIHALEKYQDIMDVMLPTLGPERQATYSPFLPISPTTGNVLYVPMKAIDAKAGTITFTDEDGTDVTMSVTGGRTKLQWKPDFGMRWAALGIDFEMYGKDHQINGAVYSKICRVLGARPPEQYCYELFLDEKGEKISKTRGNGITIDEWLTYASPESLALFMYQKPRTAKRLYFDVIPKAVDEYFAFAEKLAESTAEADADAMLQNPVWHIHGGNAPTVALPVSFAMILNLVSASNAEDKETLWGFISTYAPDLTPQSAPKLDEMVGYAIRYFEDFVKPSKVFRAPSDQERAAMADLASRLGAMDPASDGEALQTEIFEVGKDHGFENLRDWFQSLYQVLLGQDQGPRFGSFVALYGIEETRELIAKALDGALLQGGGHAA